MAHGTSQRVSKIASRVMASHNPVRSDKKLREKLAAAIKEAVEPITTEEIRLSNPGALDANARAADAIADVLEPIFTDMKTLAASALAQDKVKGE